MAIINNILNLVSCGAGGVLGTGLKGCRPILKKVTTIWLLPNGKKLDGTRELNDEYALELQASGELIVLRGIRTFTDNTPDDSTEALDDGTLTLTAQGLYQFALAFINGLYFNAALHSLSGFGNYDAIFIDRDGNILGTRANDGSLKGFTLGLVQAMKMQWATDTTAAREGLMFQMLERSEVDQDYIFIQRAQLGDFNPNRREGVNQLRADFNTAPVPGTSLVVKVATHQDGKPFVGLDGGDFTVGINGTYTEPTATEGPDGVYTITTPTMALNDVVAVKVYDNANNREIIVLNSDTYKSNEITATVVAAP